MYIIVDMDKVDPKGLLASTLYISVTVCTLNSTSFEGTRQDGGILPRSLAAIFNSIQGKLYPRMDLKPNLCDDVIKLDNKMVRQEELKKLSLLGIVREVSLKLLFSADLVFKMRPSTVVV